MTGGALTRLDAGGQTLRRMPSELQPQLSADANMNKEDMCRAEIRASVDTARMANAETKVRKSPALSRDERMPLDFQLSFPTRYVCLLSDFY